LIIAENIIAFDRWAALCALECGKTRSNRWSGFFHIHYGVNLWEYPQSEVVPEEKRAAIWRVLQEI
jgi:hypothetical protein